LNPDLAGVSSALRYENISRIFTFWKGKSSIFVHGEPKRNKISDFEGKEIDPVDRCPREGPSASAGLLLSAASSFDFAQDEFFDFMSAGCTKVPDKPCGLSGMIRAG
jgi:hypothetical protein